MVTPAARRAAVQWFRGGYDFSERRSCRLVGFSRSSFRRPRCREESDRALAEKLQELVQQL